MASITSFLARRSTEEERERRRQEAERKRQEAEVRRLERRMEADLRRELREVARTLSDRLTQLEFAYFYSRGGKPRVSRLRFVEQVATPAALYYRVDTARMPRGVRTASIEEAEVLEDLALAVRAPVSTFRHYEHGFWIIVERASSLVAVPRFVDFDEVFRQLPRSGRLVFGLGIGKSRRVHYADLGELPHLLVGGATGYGKSNFLHSLICTLAARYSNIRFLLIDLKGGVEFSIYRDLPHRVEIAKTRAEAVDMLEVVYSEVEKRLQQFEEAHVRDISSYNQYRPGALDRWVVVCDEIANLMLDRRSREKAERLLADIAARGRAPGVHLVVATQRPSVDVVTGLIKANFPARVAFNTASQADSRVILERGDAAGLGRPGLLLFSWESQFVVCQSPLITDRIEQIVAALQSGQEWSAAQGEVTEEEVIIWALRENRGELSIDAIYNAFRSRGVSHRWVRRFVGTVSGRFVINGRNYVVMSDGRGHRRVVEVYDDGRQGSS